MSVANIIIMAASAIVLRVIGWEAKKQKRGLARRESHVLINGFYMSFFFYRIGNCKRSNRVSYEVCDTINQTIAWDHAGMFVIISVPVYSARLATADAVLTEEVIM